MILEADFKEQTHELQADFGEVAVIKVGTPKGGDCYALYMTLSQAVADINNGISDNAITDTSAAKVEVFKGDTGRTTVMLLDDVSESAEIKVNKDIDIVLGGKTLTFTTAVACLNFTAGTKCTINGEATGSKIIKENIVSTSSTILIRVDGDSLDVQGGEYRASGSVDNGILIFRVGSTTKSVEICDCLMYAENTSTNTASLTKAIQTQGEKVIVKNCEAVVIAKTTAVGAQVAMGLTVEDSVFKVKTNGDTKNDRAYGIDNYGNIVVKNSTVFSDAKDCHIEVPYAVGIANRNKAELTNANIHGTHSGVDTSGSIYVNGGIYTGFCHGGFYLGHGVDGIAYINDATIRCGFYEGDFDYTDKTSDIYGSMYIGGMSDMSVYLDGCTFISETNANSIILRGTSGEVNNTVNISNSTLVDLQGIRIDNDTHTVNIGVGNNFTASNTGRPNRAVLTYELYRKKHPDAVCDGKDFEALAAIVSVPVGDEVSY